MGNPGNPNFLNDLKNTFNDFPEKKLQAATQDLYNVLQEDLPKVLRTLDLEELVVCVVPRSKAENVYHANQQLFRATTQSAVSQLRGFIDGTSYISRHTNTKTTHFRNPVPNYTNDGLEPYPGILKDTCEISPKVKGRDILLIDDIYTPEINIDEDAINALLKAGAKTVIFYAIGKVERN